MTTPERLRRRQRMESAGIAVLAIALVIVWVWFNGQTTAQQRCLTTYISINSKTTAVRAKLLAQESRTTRAFLLDATDAKSRRQFEHVRARYAKSLQAIDRARAANPVQPFPKGVCD